MARRLADLFRSHFIGQLGCSTVNVVDRGRSSTLMIDQTRPDESGRVAHLADGDDFDVGQADVDLDRLASVCSQCVDQK